MNPRLQRSMAAILAAVLLLRSYFVRELLVIELFFALLLLVAFVVGGTAYLLGSAVMSWLEKPRRGRAKSHVVWIEGSIEK